jgi:hypothetical protein
VRIASVLVRDVAIRRGIVPQEAGHHETGDNE